MHGGQRHDLEVPCHALGDLPQPGQGGRVRAVVEVPHGLAAVVVAHDAHEQVDPARGGVVDGGQHLGGVERLLAQVEQADDGVGSVLTGGAYDGGDRSGRGR